MTAARQVSGSGWRSARSRSPALRRSRTAPPRRIR